MMGELESGGGDLSKTDPLHIDMEGFEGPLHLLLEMARKQKIDLLKISILDLVGQYLVYIETAKHLRLDIAADYLVMAAWLTYLKSRLLLPTALPEEEEELNGDEMAAALKQRLARLEAMRRAGEQLMQRRQLGVHVFRRGMPEGIRSLKDSRWEAELVDLLKAYAQQQERKEVKTLKVHRRKVWSLKEARQRLEKMLDGMVGSKEVNWKTLDEYLIQFLGAELDYKTVLASSFGATLEMARDAKLELRQSEAFGPLYVRRGKREDDA